MSPPSSSKFLGAAQPTLARGGRFAHGSSMKRIGPYRIEGELGSGAMGQVFRAHDEALDRPVAIKLLGRGISAEVWQRSAREARHTARVRHPHVVGVHGAGLTPEGDAYLVLDLVEGGSLHERIQEAGKLPPQEAARIARDLADALHAAHGEGVLHRDVKPRNVLLDGKGRALLADFGLARVESSEGGLTQSGDIVGTPAYMSPEQAQGRHDRVGPATDVYGLGATLYAMLGGRPPHLGKSAVATVQSILKRNPTPLWEFEPGVDLMLAAICERCLAREPEQRYPSAAALRDALDDYLLGPRSGESRPAFVAPTRRGFGGWALVSAGLAGLGLGLLPWALDGEPPGPTGELLDRLRRGHERSSRGDHDGALQDFDAVLAAYPENLSLYFKRVEENLALEHHSAALRDLDHLEQFEVGDPWTLPYTRGRVCISLEDWTAAEALFERSLALRPHYAIAALQRGLTREKQGDAEGALADYALALEQDPRLVSARIRRAAVAFEREEWTVAKRELDEALLIDPEANKARELRANTAVKTRDFGGALDDCEAVLRQTLEGAVEVLLTRTEALAGLSRWDEAMGSCDLALWVDDEASDGYLLRSVLNKGLGDLAEQAGRTGEALERYRRSLRDGERFLELAKPEQTRGFAEHARAVEERMRRLEGR